MKNLVKVKKVFDSYPEVKLAYLFGSRATGEVGPMSDYDFAVYLRPKKKDDIFDLKLELIGKLCGAVKTDAVDLLVLNTSEKPELNYEVITKGKLIKEEEPNKLLMETMILNNYFDFRDNLRRFTLTKN